MITQSNIRAPCINFVCLKHVITQSDIRAPCINFLCLKHVITQSDIHAPCINFVCLKHLITQSDIRAPCINFICLKHLITQSGIHAPCINFVCLKHLITQNHDEIQTELFVLQISCVKGIPVYFGVGSHVNRIVFVIATVQYRNTFRWKYKCTFRLLHSWQSRKQLLP